MTLMEKFKKLFQKDNYTDSKVIYKNSTSKYSMTAECTMELSSKTEEKKKKINSQLKNLVKKYIDSPEKLIQYLRFKGAKIYKIKKAQAILSFFGEEEGFIIPIKGLKALIFNIMLSIFTEEKLKISFSTPEMLIFEEKDIEIYTVIRAVYKYYAFKNSLPGFDCESQSTFKKIYGRNNLKNKVLNLETLSAKDIFACKEALARDLDSVNFTLQLVMEYEKSKQILDKMIKDNKTHI